MIFACSRTGVRRARRRLSIDCHGSIQIVSPLGARHTSLSHCRLLWDHELAELAPIMIALARHHQEMLEHWYQLYMLHFGDERSLAQSEVFEICGLDLDATTETLHAGLSSSS